MRFRRLLPVWSFAVGALLLGGVPGTALAQFPPDSFTNLKVFPKDIPQRQLIDAMRGFAQGLGVRCQFCHVGEEGKPLSTFDFASDEKPTKQTARVMLRMVQHINQDALPEVADRHDPPVRVTCNTCHRGLERPMTLAQVLEDTLQAGGLAAVQREYARLRERYYGSGSYDFSAGTLNEFAQQVARDTAHADDALGILRINEAQYPQSGQVQSAFGDVYLARGDTAEAVARYRKAIALEPRMRQGLERRIQALTRGGAGR